MTAQSVLRLCAVHAFARLNKPHFIIHQNHSMQRFIGHRTS